MIVEGWKSVSKKIMKRDTSVWGLFDKQYLTLFMVLFMMNNTRGTIYMNSKTFFKRGQEKLKLRFLKRLMLEFLL